MDDVYENINDYNPIKKRKILIVFDDMIADIMTDKKFQTITNELFIRWRKLNISLVLAYILRKTCLIQDLVIVILYITKWLN